jgi:phosphopantothenoylcysteine decarboxylase/phosphopantothenate--cysteine ligase
MTDDTRPMLAGTRLVLGVTGSIAAYKAVGLLRVLVREGARVDVVMTRAATKFITPLTFEVLSGRPVITGLFEAHQEM